MACVRVRESINNCGSNEMEEAVDNKSLCLAGEGNGLRLFLPNPFKMRSES